MKVFHIDEFKCTLCSNWFCPPFTVPYRLKCTHSICTNCLEKSVQNNSNQIICPQDLQTNKISQITINQSTKKALQRLLKQHKNLTQNNHLECIKSLSITFDELLDSKQIELKNLSTLIDQIFENEIKRLRQIYEKIKIQINRPFRIVNDWKEVVRNYLRKIKNQSANKKGCVSEFNHYIQEGRKIKLDLNQFIKHDFKDLIDHLLLQPQICFKHTFSIFDQIENQMADKKYFGNVHGRYLGTGKFQTLGKRFEQTDQKQVYLKDLTNNFDQSSIRMGKQTVEQGQSHSNKLSLFQSLIQQTPKNTKCYNSQIYQGSKKTQSRNMIFQSTHNPNERNSKNQQNPSVKIKKGEKSSRHVNLQKSQLDTKLQQRIDKSIVQPVQNGYCQVEQSDSKNLGLKNHSNVIMQKIRTIKQKSQIQSIKKPTKMGKSLQYSPDQPNYEIFQPYMIHDSFEDQSLPYQNGNDQTTHSDQNYRVEINNISHFKTNLQKKIEDKQDQLLLDEKQNDNSKSFQNSRRNEWELQHLNFLKQWKIQKSIKEAQQLEIIQKYGGYNCEKEKNKYARKIEELRVKEILKQTTLTDNFISIVGQNLAQCNLVLLLSQIDWNYRNIEIVKFIKTGLTDTQLNQLLNFLVRSKVHTLMLSYNNLTQISLDALLHFVNLNSTLKNIYLPKNNISLLKGNSRPKINLLKQKGINLYI